MPLALLEAARNSKRVGVTAGRQGSNEERPEVFVEFVGGYDNTRSGLANFPTASGIQRNQVDLAPARWRYYRHSHSVWSK